MKEKNNAAMKSQQYGYLNKTSPLTTTVAMAMWPGKHIPAIDEELMTAERRGAASSRDECLHRMSNPKRLVWIHVYVSDVKQIQTVVCTRLMGEGGCHKNN